MTSKPVTIEIKTLLDSTAARKAKALQVLADKGSEKALEILADIALKSPDISAMIESNELTLRTAAKAK